jgi:hypothetical protein
MAIMSLCLSTNRFFPVQQWNPCECFELRTLNLPQTVLKFIWRNIPMYLNIGQVRFAEKPWLMAESTVHWFVVKEKHCPVKKKLKNWKVLTYAWPLGILLEHSDVTTDQKLASSSGSGWMPVDAYRLQLLVVPSRILEPLLFWKWECLSSTNLTIVGIIKKRNITAGRQPD